MSGAQWAHFFAQVRSQPTHVVIEGRLMVKVDVQQSMPLTCVISGPTLYDE